MKYESKRKPFKSFTKPVNRVTKSEPHKSLPGQTSFLDDPVPAGKLGKRGQEPMTTAEWVARSATQIHPDRLESDLRKLSEKTN